METAFGTKMAKNKKSKNNQGVSRTRIPAAVSTTNTNTNAKISQRGRGRKLVTVVSNDVEFFELMTGGSTGTPSDFACLKWGCSPANPMLNPWGADIVNSYDEYKLLSGKLKFVSRLGTEVAGTVMMYHDPDAYDDEPINSTRFNRNYGSKKTNVWKDLEIPLLVDGVWRQTTPSDLNSVKQQTGIDVNKRFLGSVMVATQGCAADDIGTLRFEFTVELRRPTENWVKNHEAEEKSFAAGTGAAATPLGSSISAILGGLATTFGNDRVIFWRPGDYTMVSEFAGTGFTEADPTITSSTVNQVQKAQQTWKNAASTALGFAYNFRVSEPGQYFRINLTPASPSAISSSFHRIFPYSKGIL